MAGRVRSVWNNNAAISCLSLQVGLKLQPRGHRRHGVLLHTQVSNSGYTPADTDTPTTVRQAEITHFNFKVDYYIHVFTLIVQQVAEFDKQQRMLKSNILSRYHN